VGRRGGAGARHRGHAVHGAARGVGASARPLRGTGRRGGGRGARSPTRRSSRRC
jgi:hypothetical protein